MKPQSKIGGLIESYISNLEYGGRKEVYETLLLMILNEHFYKTLIATIAESIQKKVIRGKKVTVVIEVTEEYESAVDLVCKSKYFLNNFTDAEIERKRRIAMNMVSDLIFADGFDWDGEWITPVVTSNDMVMRNISHKDIQKGKFKKTAVIFSDGVSLDEVTAYLKEVIGLENCPRKKKMSLGQSHRILQVENDVKADKEKYRKGPEGYSAQVIANEMKKRFHENVTMESVDISLRRIKKIKEDINTISDK